MVLEAHHAVIEFALATAVVGFFLSFSPDPKAKARGRASAFAGLLLAMLTRLLCNGDPRFDWEIPAACLFFVLALGFGLYYLHLSVGGSQEKTRLQLKL